MDYHDAGELGLDEKAQQLSDALHDGLDDIDNLIFKASERLQLALLVRIESGMRADEGQRTIKQLTRQLADLTSLRERHVLAHAAAQKDAEEAGFPELCPDRHMGHREFKPKDNVTQLSIVE